MDRGKDRISTPCTGGILTVPTRQIQAVQVLDELRIAGHPLVLHVSERRRKIFQLHTPRPRRTRGSRLYHPDPVIGPSTGKIRVLATAGMISRGAARDEDPLAVPLGP